jgi:hypothetical protein
VGCFAAAALAAATLSGCGGSSGADDRAGEAAVPADLHGDALPQRYGLYAVQGDHFGRLNGDQTFEVGSWEHRSDLWPNVSFIVYDRRLADPALALDQVIHLRRVPHVRNDVSAAGTAAPATADNWVAVDLPKFDVPLDFEPVATAAQMVRAIPARPLEPGLYSLELRTGNAMLAGRFGVEWNKVDKSRYMASYCVDRYVGSPVSYRACGDAPPVAARPPAGAGLQVREVQAVRRNDGSMTTLLVQGVVVNVSQAPRPVPQLVASLRDPQGLEIKRWAFTTEVSELPPGRSTGFRTEVLDPSTGPTQVSIAFAGSDSAIQ